MTLITSSLSWPCGLVSLLRLVLNTAWASLCHKCGGSGLLDLPTLPRSQRALLEPALMRAWSILRLAIQERPSTPSTPACAQQRLPRTCLPAQAAAAHLPALL